MINISPIHTDADYDATLNRINDLMDAVYGTPEGDELDILTTLVEAYERTHFSISAPDPVEFIKNIMEFMGIGQNGLAEVLNSRSRASEILNRRRTLTLDQIRRITDHWHVPSDPLISKYDVAHGS